MRSSLTNHLSTLAQTAGKRRKLSQRTTRQKLPQRSRVSPQKKLFVLRKYMVAPKLQWSSTRAASSITRTASTTCSPISISYWQREVSASPDVATARSQDKVMDRVGA